MDSQGYLGVLTALWLVNSPSTVSPNEAARTHFLHVFEKLGVSDRTGAVTRVMGLGPLSEFRMSVPGFILDLNNAHTVA